MYDEFTIFEEMEPTEEEVSKAEKEAVEAFYKLADAHIREIMSARASILHVKRMKDGEDEALKIQQKIDEYIASKGIEYQKRYEEMDVPDILLDVMIAKIMGKAERKAKEAIEEQNSED